MVKKDLVELMTKANLNHHLPVFLGPMVWQTYDDRVLAIVDLLYAEEHIRYSNIRSFPLRFKFGSDLYVDSASLPPSYIFVGSWL